MKRLADQTLYEILEVPPDATATAIAEAVEKARELYGPGSLATYTLMSSEEATLLAHRIEEAQQVLLDPAARARYDEQLAGPAEGAPAAAHANGNGTPAPGAWQAPPVIPALAPVAAGDEDREDEADRDEADEEVEVEAPAPAEVAPPPPAAPPRPAPILLSREVAPPAPAPPPAVTAPPPAAVAAPPPPAPISTPVPMIPPPVAAPPPPVPDGTAWTGEVLRRLREARGITLQQIAERTKVTRHHIENIEGDRYAALPAAVYLRGILLSIARELRLDGQKVARSYLERVAAAAGGPGAPKR